MNQYNQPLCQRIGYAISACHNIYHDDITDKRLLLILNSTTYFRASIIECDYIFHNEILWDQVDTPTVLDRLSVKYSPTKKPVIILIVSDYEKKYNVYNNLILLRTSLRLSLKIFYEFTMPYLWECQTIPFIPINTISPQIGFCGLISKHREKIINVFDRSNSVKTDFIIRDKFWGGNPHNKGLINDFNNNLQRNPFIISQRGNGNFSMRFYQVLAAGRIPVLVNTDMALPFSNKIKWNEVIVFEKDEKSCLKRVVEIFRSGEYLKMQIDCGMLFHDYFSKNNFLTQLMKQIKSLN